MEPGRFDLEQRPKERKPPMLVHHSDKPYEEAATDAARHARHVLEQLIDRGRSSAANVIDKISTEVPADHIVRASALGFGVAEGQTFIELPSGAAPAEKLSISRHALQQLCTRANVPQAFATYLLSETAGSWGKELLAYNLRECFRHLGGKYLARCYDRQLRGFLSDSYRRLDSRPLVEAFATACQTVGAVPVQGHATESKVAIKAMLPTIFEPVANEVMAFGLCWENSDYGHGPHSLRVFCLRLWCTNYAIADECFRQVHLGKRLADDVHYSRRTYELDTKTVASAVQDVVSETLSPQRLATYCDAIRAAATEVIDVKAAVARMRTLSKSESEAVITACDSDDIRMLPAGQTRWRLSNAISWVAGTVEHDERKLEMQKLAGAVLPAFGTDRRVLE
jgi:hypothetical protein